MKLHMLLKATLAFLLVALIVTIASWITSEYVEARAQGGGGSASGEWIMVASILREGEGMIYVLNTKRETLLVYAYHRGRKSISKRLFTGDLQLLAGRHVKWDVLYSQLLPYPTERKTSKDLLTPAQMKAAYEKVNRD